MFPDHSCPCDASHSARVEVEFKVASKDQEFSDLNDLPLPGHVDAGIEQSTQPGTFNLRCLVFILTFCHYAVPFLI